MIYFDNAATTFPKPPSVINEVTRCLKEYCGNPGRSSHMLALAAAEKIYDTRELIAKFIGATSSENIVFTPNATYALNLAIKGTITERCHCIISDLEHNSVLRPLYKVADLYGCDISIYDSDIPPTKAITPLIRNDTKVIITTAASNVTGKIIDLKSISDISVRHGIKLIIDASQYLGHRCIDLSKLDYHILCSAGHKALFGIQGSGFAAFKSKQNMNTLIEGGSGIETFSRDMPELMPERYEAGTLFTPAIASLYAGIKFIDDIGIDNVCWHIESLTQRTREILDSFSNISVLGAENGIISFNKKDYSSAEISHLLNKSNIATRAGYHCAPLIHEKLGTKDSGAVRVSLSYFNTTKECDALYKAIKSIP